MIGGEQWTVVRRDLELRQDASGSYVSLADPGEPGYPGGPARRSITPAEGEILSALAAGKTVVEIGTGLGISARCMATTAYRIITYDTDPWVRAAVWPYLIDLHNVTPVALEPDTPAEMVFIDGCHAPEAVRADLALARRLLKPGGLIVLHDMRAGNVGDTVRDSGIGPVFTCDTTHGLGVVWPWPSGS